MTPSFHKPLGSILIKPAGPECNMACTYCFYLKKTKTLKTGEPFRMSEAVLKKLTEQMMTQGEGQLSFGWQGGEPTLMGLDFFKKAVAFQQQFSTGKTIGNGLQTNGLLLNRDWARFLAKYQFLVGISLDGPEHIHNRYRSLKHGQGTWKQVRDKVKLLLDTDVAVNALSVINDYSVQFPEEIYQHHKSLGLNHMQFIPCVERKADKPEQVLPFSVDPEAFGEFLIKTFDLWQGDFRNQKPTTFIRFFDSIFFSYVNQQAPDCTLRSECGVYLVVEFNGDIYACDFYVQPEWKLGNIMETNLDQLLNSPLQQKFGLRKSQLAQNCQSCEWLNYCRGGCPKNWLNHDPDTKINYLCLSYQMFFNHADSRFRQLAKNWFGENNL